MAYCSGGLEMLFSDQKSHSLSIPATDTGKRPVTIAYLIDHLCRETMKDKRKELFVLDDHL
jgi:ubiquitin related modifier 1